MVASFFVIELILRHPRYFSFEFVSSRKLESCKIIWHENFGIRFCDSKEFVSFINLFTKDRVFTVD